ncbi:MAG: CCA tRNA nucleotidyltransferase [Verrucomicrobiota bacterium]
MSEPGTDLEFSAREVVRTLQQNGFAAMYAGGCVRDMLRGVEPKDYDIATSALPEQVEKLFQRTVGVGKQFGVIIVRNGSHDFEVATFREDKGYTDGRRPDQVAFTDARNDARRRDFTINAMFYDPVADHTYDYTGGQKDLTRELIRCVGSPGERFSEDHLRMMRAVRFAGSLGFRIEQETSNAIREHARLITRVSPERIGQELTRMLLESEKAGQSIVQMQNLGLLEAILPEVSATIGQEQPPQFHPEGDVFTHTVIMLDMMETSSPVLAYSALLHDIGKPGTARQGPDRIRFDGHAGLSGEMAEKILRRLKFSTETIENVSRCIRNHMRFMDVPRMKRSTLRRMTGSPVYREELELHRLDCLASHGDLKNYHYLKDFEKTLESEPSLPDPWVTGHDIMAQGIPEGPSVGYWRSMAYEAQLEGKFSNRRDLLEWLRHKINTDPGR